MYLAKDRHGRIGRKLAKNGFAAEVDIIEGAKDRGNVYFSEGSVEKAEIEEKKMRERNALLKAERVRRVVKEKGQELIKRAKAEEVARSQAAAKVNPMNQKLRRHYQMMGQMNEEARTVSMLYHEPPKGAVSRIAADFSQSGGNPEIVPGSPEYKGQWAADFRREKIVGNPLTRNGKYYGGRVPDYSVIVPGKDVAQENIPNGMGAMVRTGAPVKRPPFDRNKKVIAHMRGDNEIVDGEQVVGGTMLGRWNGMNGRFGTMGFDWSWDGITDAVSDLADQTIDQLQEDLPAHLAEELQNAIKGGGTASTSGGGIINVTRPIQQAAQNVSQTLGVPPWAIYAGVGMMGVGLLFVMIKAVKS